MTGAAALNLSLAGISATKQQLTDFNNVAAEAVAKLAEGSAELDKAIQTIKGIVPKSGLAAKKEAQKPKKDKPWLDHFVNPPIDPELNGNLQKIKLVSCYVAVGIQLDCG